MHLLVPGELFQLKRWMLIYCMTEPQKCTYFEWRRRNKFNTIMRAGIHFGCSKKMSSGQEEEEED